MKQEKPDEQVYIGLCHRCEHRAQFHETGRQPRMECGEVGKSSCACYMYRPVVPMVLSPMDKSDKRPLFGPDMISSRKVCHRLADAEPTVIPLGKDEFLVLCVPAGKDLARSKAYAQKMADKESKKGKK